MAAAITSLAKLAIADSSDFGTAPQRLDFIDFSPGVSRELRDMNGTRGKYDKDTERVRENRQVVSPTFRSEPTAVELGVLLAWGLGGAPSGTSYPLGDAVVAKHVRFDPNAGTKWQLAGVGVDVMTLRSSSGEPLTIELGLVGQTYSNPSDGFPALGLDITTQPFIMSDCVLSFNSTTRSIRDLAITVRNNIDRGRFLNSLTLTALNKLSREIVWSLALPAGDYDSLWDSGVSGASIAATFTNGNTSLSVASSSVRFPGRNPEHPFRQEGFLMLEGEAYATGGSGLLTVTLDSVPGS